MNSQILTSSEFQFNTLGYFFFTFFPTVRDPLLEIVPIWFLYSYL